MCILDNVPIVTCVRLQGRVHVIYYPPAWVVLLCLAKTVNVDSQPIALHPKDAHFSFFLERWFMVSCS